MAEFVMPSLGADMGEGKLIAWRKKVGDIVHRGEIIAEVETDKAAVDVECHIDGVIERLLVEPGQKVPVGTVLALIRTAAEGEAPLPAPAPAAPAQVEKPAPVAAAAAKPAIQVPAPPPRAVPQVPLAAASSRLRVSPYAARLAAELGVSLKGITGTGPGGAISANDVVAAVSSAKTETVPAAFSAGGADTPQARMRRAIAASMSRSKREIPHYYLSHVIDFSTALDWLASENSRLPVESRMIPAVMLLKATALALREVPELNALWEGGSPVQKESIHVGAAISLRGGGLIAPALHDTDKAGLIDLMQRFRDLVKRGRAGKLKSSEMSDPTITVTSLGDQGVDALFGVIYPPQVAIVGFGTPAERPWIRDGKSVPRRLITATLSGDHRVTDGHRGAQLLMAIERIFQEPEKLK